MSKKTIIIILAILILAILIGVAAGVIIWRRNNSGPKEIIKYNLTVDDMYSNIKESRRILKLKMTIESTSSETIETLGEKIFLIRDEVNKIVRNKTDGELEGKEGQENLQNEIKDSLGKLFPEETISSIYFNDFIIQ